MLDLFKIGHYTNLSAATGCTVIIPPQENVAAAAVRGASPGTRELALLQPEKKISQIHALLLTGGSAFGLGGAHGVMERLARQNIGYPTSYGVVPIVPAAVIFDKNIGDSLAYPTAENAAEALEQAQFHNNQTGCVGAGCGATLGKWKGIEHAMKGGLGLADITNGKVKVTALSVVNAVGDVIGFDGKILAGAIDADGQFVASDNPAVRWGKPDVGLAENTVLTLVMTNARLTKQQAYFIAENAHYGIARRIDPSHTSYDGDVAFVIAARQEDCMLDALASMCVLAVERSIINGVTSAHGLFNFKSFNDLKKDVHV